MRHHHFIFLIILFASNLAYAQSSKGQWLFNKFKRADSILLISHVLVEGSTDVGVDNAGKVIVYPQLLISGKLNQTIIKERKTIKGKQLDTLIQILLRPFIGSTISQGGCFVPRQAILLFKNRRTSFIDICFHCNSYKTSIDLKKLPPFDKERWKELLNYFLRIGFKYELESLQG